MPFVTSSVLVPSECEHLHNRSQLDPRSHLVRCHIVWGVACRGLDGFAPVVDVVGLCHELNVWMRHVCPTDETCVPQEGSIRFTMGHHCSQCCSLQAPGDVSVKSMFHAQLACRWARGGASFVVLVERVSTFSLANVLTLEYLGYFDY